ncbi:sulfotransferase domain-containing protein [Robiginitomaculum antarcticum]|uniref:sulfotransferase domain-containing protein n=1 Tax=Robiginitomaculum antarcticum TaxID=437507 RepID=UPI000475BFA0|nr:sulfotransferase domain-containing protein [Robiginitomaculum antarcticum]
MADTLSWPKKSRELCNHHFDSTIWNDLKIRDDDIIISTYGKSGTTWTQQMIAQMIFGGDPDLSVAEMSPWVDLRVPPKAVKLPEIEAQKHRRFMKTHLPVDALKFSPQAKYIYIGRDGRDVVWSLYNHHSNANNVWYDALNNTPGRIGPPIDPPPEDIREYWHDWMDKDGYPFWSFWDNVRSWWNIRNLPNVMFLHFSDMKKDMPQAMRRIADFLSIEINESRWDRIVEYCSFEWMKENAMKSVPLGGAFWDAGAKVFINKGINGRWKDVLTDDENAAYENKMIEELGEDAALWLKHGGLITA